MHIAFYVQGRDANSVDGLDEGDKEKSKEVWKAVMDTLSLSMSVADQQIIVSSLAFIVFDLMSEKVKEKKKECIERATNEVTTTWHESNTALNRFAGAALHSMIEKRKKLSKDHRELKMLKLMKQKKKDKNDPLDQGGLTSISPAMLPFLNQLLIAINEHINNDTLKEHGKEMVKVALEKLLSSAELELEFNMCIERVGIDVELEEYDEASIAHIRVEFLKKVFHSRVNEFMEARKEIELEAKGKVTNADQSLRDTLKTYSSNQMR